MYLTGKASCGGTAFGGGAALLDVVRSIDAAFVVVPSWSAAIGSVLPELGLAFKSSGVDGMICPALPERFTAFNSSGVDGMAGPVLPELKSFLKISCARGGGPFGGTAGAGINAPIGVVGTGTGVSRSVGVHNGRVIGGRGNDGCFGSGLVFGNFAFGSGDFGA